MQWSDDDRFKSPNTGPESQRPRHALFSFNQSTAPVSHKYNLDIVTAQLRTRFYYARYIMYRPFVYKTLHFEELLTADEANCCALAIKSACLWPIAMSPPRDKKRVVPHLFAWTKNFIEILLILRMITENESLRRVCESRVSQDEVRQTAALLLEWVGDVKQVDGMAEWSWGVLEPLYS